MKHLYKLNMNGLDASNQFECLNFINMMMGIFGIKRIYRLIQNDVEYSNDTITINIKNVLNKFEKFIENKNDKDIGIFISILKRLNEHVITIIVEDLYVDSEYRDSYYMHYAEEHQEKTRFCKRVHIFKYYKKLYSDHKSYISTRDAAQLQNNFIGSIVIKPLEGYSIGRTLLSAKYFSDLKGVYIREANYSIGYSGVQLDVNAFPYRMQDRITTSCSEVSLLNLFDYYSNRYSNYHNMLPSDIFEITRRYNDDRIMPVRGLTYKSISKVLYESRFTPRIYTLLSTENITKIASQAIEFDEKLHIVQPTSVLDYYIESGIPVIMGLHTDPKFSRQSHCVICVGHGRCSDITKANAEPMKTKIDEQDSIIYVIDICKQRTQLIIQDDSHGPYIIADKKANTNLEDNRNSLEDWNLKWGNNELSVGAIVVPLYRRMFMDARKAFIVIKEMLNYMFNQDKNIFDGHGESLENPIAYRLFLTRSRSLKRTRLNYFRTQRFNADIKKIYNAYDNIQMPKFIWVCELYSIEGYNNKEQRQPFGEIILDATYPLETKKSIMLTLCSRSIFIGNEVENKDFGQLKKYKLNGDFKLCAHKNLKEI